jgi:hypothetical protein
MTELLTPADRAYAHAKIRRRRARRVIQSLTLACLLAAAGVAAEQVYTGGLHDVLQRPPGVGATPPDPPSSAAVVAASPAGRVLPAH